MHLSSIFKSRTIMLTTSNPKMEVLRLRSNDHSPRSCRSSKPLYEAFQVPNQIHPMPTPVHLPLSC